MCVCVQRNHKTKTRTLAGEDGSEEEGKGSVSLYYIQREQSSLTPGSWMAENSFLNSHFLPLKFMSTVLEDAGRAVQRFAWQELSG